MDAKEKSFSKKKVLFILSFISLLILFAFVLKDSIRTFFSEPTTGTSGIIKWELTPFDSEDFMD